MVRKIRLTTGLILFVFVAGHLINHILGIHSLAAMEAGREWFLAVWRNPVGTLAFVGAMAVHLLLAAWALYARRSLKMSMGEAFQLVLGFSIPLFLAIHFVGTRGSHQMFGTDDTYAYILIVQWKFAEYGVALQTAGLFAAWIHGCIGLYFWLRLKPWFNSAKPMLFAVAVLIPVGAWLGYYIGGKEALALYEDREWRRAVFNAVNAPDREGVERIYNIAFLVRVFVGGLIGLAMIGRLVRYVLERRRGTYVLRYPEDKTVRNVTGTTILEASRMHGIPHAAVCGGRGRCST
ncbi:MAG: adenylate/guanylate cyclase domain-containing protein, partial [Alphaproteobacteria bacterium]|nr:adenylate/guanylate cyclase domain-containing protein [Alphaproteobacteria bacterium]